MLDIQDNPRFKKIFSNKFPSKFHKARDDRVYYLKPKKGRGTNSPTKKTIFRIVVKSIMVIASLGRTTTYVVVRVGTR